VRILLVVHGLPPAAAGGTEIYTRDLAEALAARPGDTVHVLAREARPDLPELGVRLEQRAGFEVTFVNNTFASAASFAETYRNPRIRAAAARLLDRFAPDVVHVQHLTCLSTDLVAEVAERGIPVVLTLNDYWLLCQRGQLLDLDLARCAGPTPAGCVRCLAPAAATPAAALRLAPRARALERRLPAFATRGARAAASWLGRGLADPARGELRIEERLRHIREICAAVSLFLAPSRTMRDAFLAFGVSPERIALQDQGIAAAPRGDDPPRAAGPLRLGFFGGLLPSKAPHLLFEAVAALPAGLATVHVYGDHAAYHGDDTYRSRLEPLLRLPGVVHHGTVAHERVAAALAALDAVVVPSIWLENAPFVIKEAFHARRPVVTADLGGMRELVTDGKDGLLFPPGDAAALGQTILRLAREPGLIARLRAGIAEVTSIAADAAWTRERYADLLAPRLRGSTPGTPRARLAAIILNHRTPLDTVLAARSLETSRPAPDEVIVVDNGSGDGSAASLRAALPGVTHLASAQNLGFSAGLNLGIRHALERGAHLVLLLNADVLLPADAIARLREVLERHPEVGIVGPVLLARGDPRRVASTGLAFSPRTGRMRHIDHGIPSAGLDLGECLTRDAVSGAAVLVRREVFERAGLFAEDYFFSFEEIDFAARARRIGFTTALAGRARAYHEGSRSIGAASPRRIYFAARNHLKLAAGFPLVVPGARLARAAAIVGFNLAHVLFTAGVARGPGLLALARGVRDHLRGRYGPDGEA
jgi:GT2 family glycosyltransferase/glycosyltransferase involved in cell wall biosynthesis